MAAHALHGIAWRVCLALQYSRGALGRTRDALAIAPESRPTRKLTNAGNLIACEARFSVLLARSKQRLQAALAMYA